MSVTVGAGGKVALAGGTAASRSVLVTSALSIAGSTGAWTGQLDLGGNDLIVHGGDLPTVTDQARSGFNLGGTGGLFAGQGITSAKAAADAAHLTAVGVIANTTAAGGQLYTSFDGQPVSASDVLVRYTYFGDTNLDGVVNASDYGRVDAGFVGHLSGWANGDFNYDGVVDGSDYALIDNAFNAKPDRSARRRWPWPHPPPRWRPPCPSRHQSGCSPPVSWDCWPAGGGGGASGEPSRRSGTGPEHHDGKA